MRQDSQPGDIVACWPLVEEDRRALFCTHMNTYGQFNLQMDRHLDLGLPQAVR
jgi:hypothetical protein